MYILEIYCYTIIVYVGDIRGMSMLFHIFQRSGMIFKKMNSYSVYFLDILQLKHEYFPSEIFIWSWVEMGKPGSVQIRSAPRESPGGPRGKSRSKLVRSEPTVHAYRSRGWREDRLGTLSLSDCATHHTPRPGRGPLMRAARTA
jgi:hypothetical protein